MTGNEAVTAAKKEHGVGVIHTLSTGVRIRLRPVALGMWQDALAELRKKEPKVPSFANPEKGGRLEENPNDPDYLRGMAAFIEEQGRVSSDVQFLFGVELVDGLPEDKSWLAKLRLLQRLGAIDLSGFDLNDPTDLEFLYKKHVAIGPTDATLVGRGWGPSEEEVAEAASFFPPDAEQHTN